MSSTRYAEDDSVFHQCGYASSPVYERGLMSNAVVKRCAKLTRADRELILFVQYLSHQPGGLKSVAETLVSKHAGLFGTRQMVKIGKRAGQNYTAEEVKKIREDLPPESAQRFPLRGETKSEMKKTCGSKYSRFASRLHQQAKISRRLMELAEGALVNHTYDSYERMFHDVEFEEAEALERKESGENPTSYPVDAFLNLCCDAALNSVSPNAGFMSLEKEISRLCVDAEYDLAGGPWYFSGLADMLREYEREWEHGKSKVVVTNVGKKVCETLEFTQKAGGLSLLISEASLGQYFAARAWCEQHPGRARCVAVPPSNDEASFFRAIARALGLGNFTNYKNVQIRERVECVLRSGDILLVLNQAQNLWPQKNLREAFPGRLAWLLDMVKQGASACMISGPQFFMQKRACEKTGWDSPELLEKIFPFKKLPDSLDISDLQAVAHVMLPEASETILESVALYAFSEDHYLAGLERVAKRAKILAERGGRTQPTAQDIVESLKFVSGSDAMLRKSFSPAKLGSGSVQPAAPAMPKQTEIEPPAAARETRPAPAAPTAFSRRSDSVNLVQA